MSDREAEQELAGAERTVPAEEPPDDAPASVEARSRLSAAAATIADAAGPVIGAVGHLTSGARRAIGERSGARVRRVREMGRQPLANLWDVFPEARRAPLRELGMLTIPIDEIAGTAVEGPIQRGGDFLPVRDRRGDDWRGRWQRILGAVDRLATLPPIDVLRVGDRYWVIDGHNRVAAALYTGQVAIDANVVEVRLPGTRGRSSTGNLAPYLEGSRDVREAGSGRLARTIVRPTPVLPEHPLDEHDDAAHSAGPAADRSEA